MAGDQFVNRIREMCEAGMSPPQIASELKITRQWVYKICSVHSIPYAGRGKPMPRVVTGGVRIPINSRVAGAIGEMLAACDLMARGYQVFAPILNSRGHDLIAVKGRRTITVEVRCGWKREAGNVTFGSKADATSHIYAIVVTGEPVLYKACQSDVPKDLTDSWFLDE